MVHPHRVQTGLDGDRPTAIGQDSTIPAVDDHIRDVGTPERAAHRGVQELLVFAESPELTCKAEVRGQGLAPLLELLRHEPSMLTDIHPPLERKEGQDDGHDGPEDSRPEA
jgi:hypothetical protein